MKDPVRGKGFLCGSLCDLRVSVVKVRRKNPPQRRRDRTENRRGFFIFLLLTAFCLLPTAFSQNQPSNQPQPIPTPSPAPSPSPSPTPPPNLHQWGAVTSFHGLPSDRTHAIAQKEFGVRWFVTEGGLARYDGRRTNAINDDGLPAGGRVGAQTYGARGPVV